MKRKPRKLFINPWYLTGDGMKRAYYVSSLYSFAFSNTYLPTGWKEFGKDDANTAGGTVKCYSVLNYFPCN